eukprot:1162034-Pelagomonas_calceolata.AAC.4
MHATFCSTLAPPADRVLVAPAQQPCATLQNACHFLQHPCATYQLRASHPCSPASPVHLKSSHQRKKKRWHERLCSQGGTDIIIAALAEALIGAKIKLKKPWCRQWGLQILYFPGIQQLWANI